MNSLLNEFEKLPSHFQEYFKCKAIVEYRYFKLLENENIKLDSFHLLVNDDCPFYYTEKGIKNITYKCDKCNLIFKFNINDINEEKPFDDFRNHQLVCDFKDESTTLNILCFSKENETN